MQVKLWYDDERLVAAIAGEDGQLRKKMVNQEALAEATEEEPFLLSFTDERPGMTPASARPIGERPMVEQDRHFKRETERKLRAEAEGVDPEDLEDVEGADVQETDGSRLSRRQGELEDAQDEADQKHRERFDQGQAKVSEEEQRVSGRSAAKPSPRTTSVAGTEQSSDNDPGARSGAASSTQGKRFSSSKEQTKEQTKR
jgi:hypothetical protein